MAQGMSFFGVGLKEKPNRTRKFSKYNNFKKLQLTVKKSGLDKRGLELLARTTFKEGNYSICIVKLLSSNKP